MTSNKVICVVCGSQCVHLVMSTMWCLLFCNILCAMIIHGLVKSIIFEISYFIEKKVNVGMAIVSVESSNTISNTKLYNNIS